LKEGGAIDRRAPGYTGVKEEMKELYVIGFASGRAHRAQASHLLEELPISPAPNRQDPAEYQW